MNICSANRVVGALVAVLALLLPLPTAAQTILAVSPNSFALQAPVGTNVAWQSVSVLNDGTGALKWSLVPPSASWLSVSPTSGVQAGVLTLTFRTSGLGAGVYQTAFDVVENNSGVRARVSVQVTMVGSSVPSPVPSPGGTLYVTCPANRTVQSSNGSAVAVTYSATTEGGVAPVTVSGTPASGSLFPVGTTTVQVNARSSDGQSSWCSFTVTVTSTTSTSTGGQLYVTCPANKTVASSTGSAVAVTYSATTEGGVAPVTVSYNPTSGSLFPVGTTTVQVNARSSDGQSSWCSFTATVTYASAAPAPAPAPPTSSYGPRSTITCPSGAVDIWPGVNVQSVVNSYGAATTYCLRAGVHSLTSSIRPKTGDTFVGEYGAILDGSGWSTSDDTQGAFRAHNEDIDSVTIRNLVIRNMPRSGIHTYYWMSNHWTIESNEIAYTKIGIEFSPNFTIRNNYIHHNVGNASSSNPGERGGGYQGFRSDNTTFESNEIAYNGPEQKVGLSANVTFRNNFVHHNLRDGIWYDTNSNAGALIDGNRVEDNGRNGIFFEASIGATIRSNTVRRHPGEGVLISMSQNAQIYNNTLEGNFSSIQYFLNCDSLALGEDVKNNAAYDNTVVVGTQSYAAASGFSYLSSCSATQVAAYLNGSKNLTFSRNAYRVPSLSGRYMFWGGWKYWNEWQALGHDTGGSMTQ